MSTRQPKNRQRVSDSTRRAQRTAALDRVNLAALGSKTPLSRGAADLAQRLILASSGRRARLSDRDVLIGMTAATYLCALALGMTTAAFVAWIHDAASELGKS